MTKGFRLVFVGVMILIRGAHGEKLRTLDEQLRYFHIGLTETDLRGALKNEIPEVRGLAADKLAEIGEPDAIQYIEVALIQETIPRIGVEMAFALARMKDTKGIEALTHMCNDTSLNSVARIKASRYVADLGRLSCLDSTLTLANDEDDKTQAAVMQVLPELQRLGADPKRLTAAAESQVTNTTSFVRLSALRALKDMKAARYPKVLQDSILIEQNEDVRRQMELLQREK